MNREELRRTLERLRRELARAEPADEAMRERLRVLQADIQAALDQEPAEDGTLRRRLEDGVAHFEASHPELARSIAQVIDTLAFYGL
jgi:hypothetical protein